MAGAPPRSPRTWWEELGIPFQGRIAVEAILSADSPEEQRIQRLRETVMPSGADGRDRLSTERARLVTESYRQTEGEHPAIRRARAIANVFRHIPIPNPAGQLLLGTAAADVRTAELPIELMTWTQDGAGFVERHPNYQVAPTDAALLTDTLIPYWLGRGRGDYALRELQASDPEALTYQRASGAFIRGLGGPLYHTIQDYNSVLLRGLDALKADVASSLAEIRAAARRSHADLERRNHYLAILIVADGMIAYAERCADLADAAAGAESDPERAGEYHELARICRKVPRLPADTWWEALQSLHFLRMATALAECGGSHCVGRFDQYMWPLLKRELDRGRIDRARAQLLLECLFVKWNETPVYAAGRGTTSEGMRQNDKLTIGGTDIGGADASNDLSYMCLEAHAHVHLNDPNLSLRVHRNTPDPLLRRALEVIRLGGGLPQLIVDEAIVPALMANCGLTLADARNYADIGCQENASDPNVAPDRDTNGYTNTGWFNVVKPVELALFGGLNPLTGQQVGPATGDPRTFPTMAHFVEAARQQYDHAARMNAAVCAAIEYSFQRYYPCVFHNLMHPGPRRTGIDINAGGCHYNWSGSLGVGLASAGDSLSAVNHLIYETRATTWDQLLPALREDWAGQEELRQLCIRAPKYGAADPRADTWSRLASQLYADAFAKCWSPKGGKLVVGLVSMASFNHIGRLTGATPDGRRRSEPVADSTSPSRYAPALGPTAAHLSNARGIDTYRTPNGVTFNQRFSTSAVQSERDLSRWADLVRTFVDTGGQSVQYTIVDRDMLVDAQRHPQRYRDLFVRVGGYSALFVELSREVQDAVIERAEQSF